jgi:hypothetical protein
VVDEAVEWAEAQPMPRPDSVAQRLFAP